MIKFQNITKIYPSRSGEGSIFALQDVSFELKEGEFVSITGKSGAGKSTLFKLLIGQEKPSKGQIFFRGEEVQKIKPRNLFRLRRRFGVVFQNYSLFPAKMVYENVAYPLEVTGMAEGRIKNEVAGVLDIVGLAARAYHLPQELSEGEKQRAAIARALVVRPEVIIADEPTGNLDPYNTRDIIKLLYTIYEQGTTVLLATHDQVLIDRLGKRVITLESGRLVRDEERGKFIL